MAGAMRRLHPRRASGAEEPAVGPEDNVTQQALADVSPDHPPGAIAATERRGQGLPAAVTARLLVESTAR